MNDEKIIEVGKQYRITHSRKGQFTANIVGIRDEWVDCVITDGKAGAMLDYNEREKGEAITVRRSFCTFKPIGNKREAYGNQE